MALTIIVVAMESTPAHKGLIGIVVQKRDKDLIAYFGNQDKTPVYPYYIPSIGTSHFKGDQS
jgi:hypothetical protein